MNAKNTVQGKFFMSALFSLFAFIAGFGLAWMIFDGGSKEDDSAAKTSHAASDIFSLPLGHNTVSVDEQRAGDSVFISLATLSRGAWIAIHEDSGGLPSNILGARYFPAGKTAGTVDLLRATTPGTTYYAVIHMDDGNREFDFRRDEPLQDPFGNMILGIFTTFLESEKNGEDDMDSEIQAQ